MGRPWVMCSGMALLALGIFIAGQFAGSSATYSRRLLRQDETARRDGGISNAQDAEIYTAPHSAMHVPKWARISWASLHPRKAPPTPQPIPTPWPTLAPTAPTPMGMLVSGSDLFSQGASNDDDRSKPPPSDLPPGSHPIRASPIRVSGSNLFSQHKPHSLESPWKHFAAGTACM